MERVGDGARYGLRIAYSREPQPLETAGGLAQARALLGDERLAACLDQRLGDGVGQGTQPLAAARREEHGLHSSSSSSLASGASAA